MKSIKRKELILSMIKDDLINWKLIYTFNHLGLQADEYTLYVSETILKLMRIESHTAHWEKVHKGYIERTHKVQQINILASPRLLIALAEEIYDYLKKKRAEEKLAQDYRTVDSDQFRFFHK